MEEINKRHSQVQKWLEEKFQDTKVPDYEINEKHVNYLCRLLNLNAELDHLAQLAIEDMLLKKREYKLEAQRMKEILDSTGLPISALSNAGKTSLKTLSDLALLLNLKDTKTSSYCLGIKDLTNQLSQVTLNLNKKRKDVELLQERTSTTLTTLSNMLNATHHMNEYASLDETVYEKRKQETSNLQKKVLNYKTQIDQRLEPTFDKAIHHEALVKLSHELKKLKQELKPLSGKFQTYRSLPPDMHLAKVKVEEAKRELKKLENELQSDIDVLATL